MTKLRTGILETYHLLRKARTGNQKLFKRLIRRNEHGICLYHGRAGPTVTWFGALSSETQSIGKLRCGFMSSVGSPAHLESNLDAAIFANWTKFLSALRIGILEATELENDSIRSFNAIARRS